MKKRRCGIFISVAISCLVLVVFFGEVIRNPDAVYFANSGDGFKAYFTALYHVQHDTSCNVSSAMNYPFGELYAFTDGQPLVVNTIRFISRYAPGITSHTVGIINLLMLFSVVLGALFIYLILAESGAGGVLPAVAAAGIAVLSPQVARMGGHFSLAWGCWIPMMAWLLILFEKKRKLLLSLLIGAVLLLSGMMHFYFIGLLGFLTGGYWLYRILNFRKDRLRFRDLLHPFFQFLLPVLLLQLFMFFSDNVSDRPAYPFGYQSSVAHPVAIFLPSSPPWNFVPQIFTVFNHISWESYAYIGSVAMAGFWAGLFLCLRKIFRNDFSCLLPESKPVGILFWISAGALLFAFGIPFVFGLKIIPEMFPVLRQLRVLARFAWLFYYFINIVVFLFIFKKAFVKPSNRLWKAIALFSVALLLTEGVFNIRGVAGMVKNRNPLLEDRENLTEANRWVKDLDAAAFQAVIPLPYFHVGSENIWINGGHGVKETAMMVSLKTGLPLTGVELSRTSRAQTYVNYALFTEPQEELRIPDYLKSDKPFLVLLMNGYEPTEPEKWLLNGADSVLETEKFTLYRLPVDQIRGHFENWGRHIREKFAGSRLFPHGDFLISDSTAFYRYESFDRFPSPEVVRGAGAFAFPAGEWKIVFQDTLREISRGEKMWVSFWVNSYRKDAYMRANLEVVQKNMEGDSTILRTEFFSHIKAFRGDWALIEFELETIGGTISLVVSVRNKILPESSYVIDELLVRERGLDVWQQKDHALFCNGRFFNLEAGLTK